MGEHAHPETARKMGEIRTNTRTRPAIKFIVDAWPWQEGESGKRENGVGV